MKLLVGTGDQRPIKGSKDFLSDVWVGKFYKSISYMRIRINRIIVIPSGIPVPLSLMILTDITLAI